MKKVLLFSMISLLFVTGCFVSGDYYKVYPKKITKNVYSWEEKNKYSSPIRVIGVFKNTEENFNKVNEAIKEVISFYKKHEKNTLKFRKVTIDENELVSLCKSLLFSAKFGRHFSYTDERNFMRDCINKHMFDQKKLYYGSELKVKNNCVYIAKAYNHRLYNAKMCVYVKRQDNEIVVFIYGKPKTRVAVKWFIEFNNRLVETFKKYGLHNIGGKKVFIVYRKYGLKEFLKKYY